MSHHEQEGEEEGKGEQEGKRDLTTQTMSSSVDMKESFSIPEREELEASGNAIASCLSRKLIGVVLRNDEADDLNGTVALFSYSPSSTKKDDFDFKLVQLFENCEIEVSELYFTPCSRYLVCTGACSDDADLLVVDFEGEEKLSRQEISSKKKNKQYELKSLKVDLGNVEDQKMDYLIRPSMNCNFSQIALCVISPNVEENPALGVLVLDTKKTLFQQRLAYFDMREVSPHNYFESLSFSPHDENLLAFGCGSECRVVNTATQQKLISFKLDEVSVYTVSCYVAWPRKDRLFFAARDVFYVADVSRQCVIQKTALPARVKECPLSYCFLHPFRSSSIVVFAVTRHKDQNFNYFFLDVSGGEGEIQQQHEQKDSQARIVHHIRAGPNEGDKEEKKKEGEFLFPTFSCFLSPSSLITSGTMYNEISSFTSSPALVCFKNVPQFSWLARRRIWLVREKGNENNVAIVRVLREIYFVCQLVCLFA